MDPNETIEWLEKTSGVFGGLLPQLFFDLIGRMIPGNLIFWGFVLTVAPVQARLLAVAQWAFWGNSPMVVFVVIILYGCICYSLAMIFYGLFSFLDRRSSTLIPQQLEEKFRELFPRGASARENRISKENKTSDLSYKHDMIKLLAPGAGARIVKIKAEIHFASSLLPATGIFCPFALVRGFQASTRFEWALASIAFGVAFFGLLELRSYLNNRWATAINSYYDVLCDERITRRAERDR